MSTYSMLASSIKSIGTTSQRNVALLTKKLRLLLFLLFPANSVWASTTDSLRLSLAEALTIANQHNLSFKSAKLSIDKAKHDRRSNLAKLFPTINLNGQYGYTLKKQKVYFGSEKQSASPNPMASFFPSDGIEMGQSHNISTSLNASLALVSPQLWASLALDKIGVEIALEKSKASAIAMQAEVRKAYLAVLFAQDNLFVQQAALESMKNNHRNIIQKYEQGLVPEYDVIRMNAQVKNMQPSILQAEQQVHLAQMKLLVLMGLEPDKQIRLTEQLSNYESELQNLDTYILGNNLNENSNLRQLDFNLKQLSATAKLKRSEYLPNLALSFNYNYNFASDYLKLTNNRRWTPSSTIGLSLNIPLFTGGSTRHGLKSIKTQQELLRVERTNAENQLRLKLLSEQNNLTTAKAQYDSSKEAESSAQRGLDIATVRYKAGNGTLLELNDAELALRQAQLHKAQAIYNYMITIYTLDELQGRSVINQK